MTQIAVKLPDSLIRAVDDLVAEGVFSSRSSAVRLSLEAAVAAQRREAVERAYAEGYGSLPEGEQELSAASRLAIQAIKDEPWEKWW